MAQKMFYSGHTKIVAPALNIPNAIRDCDEVDDDTSKGDGKNEDNDEEEADDDDHDLIFGSFDDEETFKGKEKKQILSTTLSSTTDESLHNRSETDRVKKRERTSSSFCALNDEWDNIFSITDVETPPISISHHHDKSAVEPVIGMSNFRVKHRLHSRLSNTAISRWKQAVKKVALLKDPWIDFKIDRYPEEIVTRHQFDPIKRVWEVSQISIKMEAKPLAHGSMRECFRMKKRSVFSNHHDWEHSSNYIAKRYVEDVPMARYFDDVMMQMTTKLWAAHYNRHNPPKKVDIVQMSVLEFKNRAGRPYYHLERFIEGNYIKYNSNSGFVCDDTLRHTPQAFSHFTFEASGHEQIVVDIQGVGDLYTDPQIHTSLGVEYGEGNLGIRGMALFFSTHECNPICSRLNLTEFDLSPGERERQLQQHHPSSPIGSLQIPAKTTCRGSEEPLHGLSRFGSLLRRLRSHSSISEDESEGYVSEASSMTAATAHLLDTGLPIPKMIPLKQSQFMTTFSEENLPLSPPVDMMKIPSMSSSFLMSASPMYSRTYSELSFNIEDLYNATTANGRQNNHRASSVLQEKAEIEKFHEMSVFYEKYESILGQIHLEMCKYHQVGRFSDLGSEEFDECSAYFHLEQAAELSIKEAILALGKIYLDLPRDILPNYQPTDQLDQFSKGFRLMIQASELQETEAILYLAQTYDKGVPNSVEQDWKQAAGYYERYIRLREFEMVNVDEDSGNDDGIYPHPTHNGVPFHDQHDIVARLATLYKTGGFNLACNYGKAGNLFNKAAEMAISVMKGRLANKYYEAAEQAYALESSEVI